MSSHVSIVIGHTVHELSFQAIVDVLNGENSSMERAFKLYNCLPSISSFSPKWSWREGKHERYDDSAPMDAVVYIEDLNLLMVFGKEAAIVHTREEYTAFRKNVRVAMNLREFSYLLAKTFGTDSVVYGPCMTIGLPYCGAERTVVRMVVGGHSLPDIVEILSTENGAELPRVVRPRTPKYKKHREHQSHDIWIDWFEDFKLGVLQPSI